MDLATLGIAVDSRDVKSAASDLDRLTTAGGKAEKSVSGVASSAKLLAASLAGAAVGLVINKYVQLSDEYTNINNRLKLVTNSTKELAQAQSDVFTIAQNTRQSLSGTAELYQRIAMNSGNLGLSMKDMAGIVETINKTLVISGASAQSAQAALVQLGQAFASGTLRGEELNSVLEQAPALAKAIAEGMGRSTGELKKMGEQGLLTADKVIESLKAMSGSIDKDFGKTAATVSQSMTKLENSVEKIVGTFDSASGASSNLAGSISDMADVLGDPKAVEGAQALAAGVVNAFTWMAKLVSSTTLQVKDDAESLAAFFNGPAIGDIDRLKEKLAQLEQAKKNSLALGGNGSKELNAQIAKYNEYLRLSGVVADKTKYEFNSLNNELVDLTTNISAPELPKFAIALTDAQKAALKLREEISDTLRSLEQQAATIGYSSDELKIYELYSKGATQADLERARAALKIVDSYQQQSEIIQSINTDLEKSFKETLAGIETSANLPIDEYTKNAKEMEKLNDQIGQSLSDALMKGGKNAAEYIQDYFRTLVLRPIIEPIAKGIAAILSGSASTAFADGGGSLSDTLSLSAFATRLSGIGTSLEVGLTGIATTTAAGLDSVATFLASSNSALLQSAGQWIGANAYSIGIGAGVAAGAAGGYAVGKMISGNYSLGGNQNTTILGGSALGAYIGLAGGPLGAGVGALIGGAVGGIVNRAFGQGAKKTTDYGISGTFASTGASVAQFADWKRSGGWFSSGSKGTSMSDVSPEFAQFLNDAITATTAATKQYAAAIGLSADAVDGFSQQIRISLQGLDEAGQQQAISDALAGFNNAMVEQTYSAIQPFSKAGETASDTLLRLSQSLTSVNSTFDTLGTTLIDISATGADAASKLLDAFGGLERFGSVTGSYYQNFYTEAERTSKTTEQLGRIFSSLNVVTPKTREQFRALVDAQDLTTESGRAAYVALLNVSDAFATIAPTIEQAAAAAAEAAQTIPLGIKNALREANAAFNETIIKNASLGTPSADLMAALDNRSRLIAFGVDSKGNENAAAQSKALGEMTAKAVRGVLERAGAIQLVFNGDPSGIIKFAQTYKGDAGAAPAMALLSEFALRIPDVESAINTLTAFATNKYSKGFAYRQDYTSSVQGSGLTGIALNSTTEIASLAATKTALKFMRGEGIAGVLEAKNNLEFMRKSSALYQSTLADLGFELSIGRISADEYAQAVSFAGEMTRKAGGVIDQAAYGMAESAAKFAASQAGESSIKFYLEKLSEGVKTLNAASDSASEAITTLAQTIGRMKSTAFVFGTSADAIIPKNATKAIGSAIANVAKDAAGFLNTKGGIDVKNALGDIPALAGVDWQKIGPMLDSVSAFNVAGYEDSFTRLSSALGEGAINTEQYTLIMGYAKDLFLDTASSMADAANAIKSNASEIVNMTKGAIDQISNQIGQTFSDRMLAQSKIDSAVLSAKSGAGLPDSSSLKDAIDALSSPSSQFFSNKTDYLESVYRANNSLRELNILAQKTATKTTDDVVAELVALREEVKNLRAESQATARATVKTANILRDVTQDGTTLSTTVVA